MTAHARRLDELRSTDAPAFGGKSAGLGELLAAGIPVPPGFALGTSAFSAFMSDAGLDATVGAGVEASTVAAIRAAPVPAPITAELAERYAQLEVETGVADPPVAVRSSAVGEDSHDATFAGLQDTSLWVRGAEPVCAAVRDCWASLYSAPAIAYRAKLDPAAPPAMGVTIQLMVDAAVSGVMFTCNPVSGDPSMVSIDASWGLGVAVVGGEVTPDEFLVSKVTGEVVRERISSKHVQYVNAPGGCGTRRMPVPEAQREAPCLDAGQLGELLAVSRRVESHFGCHQDIEWAIAAESASLFVVQSRPVTATAAPSRPSGAPQSALALVMGTFGVKPGVED